MDFIQYMEVSSPLDGVDIALDCVLMGWETGDEVPRTSGASGNNVRSHDLKNH